MAGLDQSPKKPQEQYVRTHVTDSGKENENRQVNTNVMRVCKQQRQSNIINVLKMNKQYTGNANCKNSMKAVQDPQSALQKECHQACNQKITYLQKKCSNLELQIRCIQERMQQKSDKHPVQNREWCQKHESLRKREEGILEHMRAKETELQNLRRLNMELQESAINHFDQINATITEMKSTGKISLTDCEPPVGYIRKDDKMIHLGRDQWMPTESYAMAASNARTPSMFVRNMTVAVFGFDRLLKGTISGVGSNRNQRTQAPEDKLNPIQIMALKDIFRHWMLKEQRMSEVDADIEVENTRKYIGRKIADLKSQSQSNDRSRNKSSTDNEDADEVENENIDAEAAYSDTQDDASEQSAEDVGSSEEIEQKVDGLEEINQRGDSSGGSEQDMFNSGESQEDIFAELRSEKELPDPGLSQAGIEIDTEFSQKDFDSMTVVIGSQ